MRVLTISCAAHGHFYPLVPVMRAMAAAGHDVVSAVPADFVDVVRAEGLRAHGVVRQTRTAAQRQAMRRGFEALPPRERIPAIVGNFVAVAEDGLDELDVLFESFAPDVVLRESMAFAGWVLGARRGVPVVVFDVFPVPPPMWAGAVGDRLQALRRAAGVDADPTLETLPGALTLLCGPPSWFTWMPSNGELFRPSDAITAGRTAPPPWLDELAPPIVYATLGTTFNMEPGLWTMVLDALEPTGLSVVATLGAEMDPTSLGPRPARMRLERFVPQHLVLDRCAAAVTHGGYGSLMGCLARGVPVVSVPIAAGDNVPNATRVAGLGAGIAVLPKERSAERITLAVERVLREPGWAERARGIADEIAALPPIERAVASVERIVGEKLHA
jgi:UDP:flavonoid glycosyltransferase YjiC (YdhE family)